MFGSVVLEVAIGLVLIFSLYSLLASTLSEIFTSFLNLRASTLREALRRMLADDDSTLKDNEGLLGSLVDHPNIKYLGRQSVFKKYKGKPAYIGSKLFANTLVDVLIDKGRGQELHESPGGKDATRKNLVVAEPGVMQQLKSLFDQQKEIQENRAREKSPPGKGLRDMSALETNTPKADSVIIEKDTLQQLNLLFTDAQDDLARFKTNIEEWFNQTMKSASGWYKQKVQVILIVIGFILAVAFNASTFQIVHSLSTDKQAREQMVNLAVAAQEKYGTDTSQVKDLKELLAVKDSLVVDIQKSGSILGMGWNHVGTPCTWGYFFSNFWGYIVTALAVSLGAPFWFEVLNKLVNLRSSVKIDSGKSNTAAG